MNEQLEVSDVLQPNEVLAVTGSVVRVQDIEVVNQNISISALYIVGALGIIAGILLGGAFRGVFRGK